MPKGIYQRDPTRKLGGGKRAPLDVRFWKKVEGGKPGAPDACWNWIGARNSSGYGLIWTDGKKPSEVAHRVVYRLLGLPDPPPVFPIVCDHICKNPRCVNPAHLRWVTQTFNVTANSESPHGKNSRKAVCPHGHPYTPENTAIVPGRDRRGRKTPQRGCLTCYPRLWMWAVERKEAPPGARRTSVWRGPFSKSRAA